MLKIMPLMLSLFVTKPGIIIAAAVVEGSTAFLPSEIAPLANLGAMGCVLLWFMLRSEPRMVKLTEALDRMTKMNGYVLIALESLHPAVKKQVQVLIDEVETAEAQRKK